MGSSIPPPRVRQARWTPPHIGAYFVRNSDLAVFQVRNVYRRDRQVQMVPAVGDGHMYVNADDLKRDWRLHDG